jgi:AcrR family transcriptional regulator
MAKENKKNTTADKKELIRACAKELFSEQGFKDTNVADITRKAGVATGTFYLYYTSKDSLFMEIYLEENVKLKNAIMADFNPEDEPLQALQKLMQLNIAGMNANPILREWFNKEVFSKIEENFNAENGLDSVDFMYENFLDAVHKWQDSGKLRKDIDAEMIMALLSVVVIVDLHKEEIGMQYFPQIQAYLTEFIMAGLYSTDGAPAKGGVDVH